MVSTGTLIFSSALFGLIACLFGIGLSLLFAGAMIATGKTLIALVAVPFLLASVVGFYFLYGWFTEDV
ncbi:hypothetical protein M199_gp214 [Halogranum tailed virus 1]|uniref:Transmembrane protein n=1 Tax=Halogranum tailed virus 1 TaxID=1273749 RepID=R4TL98_9CAUD|nr:hypothetical protein M199_gp214 [Halogranum tailed virus 1]AGM11452.1 hypothetical protein HGTV1_155 [Halogranum tailed virus 1]